MSKPESIWRTLGAIAIRGHIHSAITLAWGELYLAALPLQWRLVDFWQAFGAGMARWRYRLVMRLAKETLRLIIFVAELAYLLVMGPITLFKMARLMAWACAEWVQVNFLDRR